MARRQRHDSFCESAQTDCGYLGGQSSFPTDVTAQGAVKLSDCLCAAPSHDLDRAKVSTGKMLGRRDRIYL